MRKASLAELADKHLTLARDAASGRSAQSLLSGHTRVLRQTLIALAGGRRLEEHENPGEATVHVLQGQVRMVAGDDSCDADAGDILVVPDARHSLEAQRDSVVLLTLAKSG